MRRNPSQNAAFFTKSEHTLQSCRTLIPSFHSLRQERLGFYIIASQFFATLIQERVVDLGCCLLAAVTKFQGRLASLKRVSSSNSQDNFQICCADMYLVRFLANFAGFRQKSCEFRGISWIYLKFAAPRPREISEALIISQIQIIDINYSITRIF